MLILHISDIHFRKTEVATTQDPNFHLRNELVRDVVAQCQKLGPPDVVIVSGDIAFAGDPAEFAFATDWLRELCEACGAKLKSVFVCPGNHDVVRERSDRYMVQLIHNAIKSADDPVGEISRQMRDPDARRLLYEGLDNYNTFAFQFFCDLLPPERTRATRDLSLNDGSTLRIWGLNTAFVSSTVDKERDLFVDQASLQIPRSAGVVNLVVAHHDLSWLRQSQILEDHLNDVAPVQIFGHVHTNRIRRDVEFIRLTASAVHPEKSEPNWEPGYNLLELNVEGAGDSRHLKLKAHVQVWQAAPGGFRPKMARDHEVWEHSIKLEAWTAPVSEAVTLGEAAPSNDGSAGTEGIVGTMPKEGSAMNKLRDVGLRFYRLSFSKKSEIAGRLGLLEEEDMMQPDFERFRRVFQRANQREKLDELATAVQDAENGVGGK